jgi:hypothetical protein
MFSISKIVEGFNADIPKDQENSRLFWDLIEKRLSFMMRTAADIALKKNLIQHVTRDKYFISSRIILNFSKKNFP